MTDVMTDKIIEVTSIVTRFGAKEVHRGVSLAVERGSVTAIIGGSGSGKSVLLREMLGLLRPQAGSVRVAGEPVFELSQSRLSELRTRIGVLFQGGALLSGLSVRDNVAAPLREWLAVREPLLSSIVDCKLILAGLSPDTGSKMPAELSGGMVKRAALARAIALEPEILFLDEPTSGLDPVTARAFDELVRTLCDGLGLTVCMITHDLASLASITDKVIVLGDGVVVTEGTYDQVRRFPHPWIQSYFSATP